MGFPVGYPEVMLPKLFLHILSVLGFMRKLMFILFRFQPDIAWPDPTPEFESVLIGEILPVVKFSELEEPPEESCAVCLVEFEGEEEIRRLTNCRHIFHRGCLDRWMGYDQRTCPLCRTPFISDDDMQAACLQ